MSFESRWHALLGWQPPSALTLDEWARWHRHARRERPLAYALAESLPDAVRAGIRWLTAPGVWLADAWRYRVRDRLHRVSTGLPPGYYDASTRLLHASFQLLVDYVEIEKASLQVTFSRDPSRTYPRRRRGRRWAPWRCPEAGLDYLAWEQTLCFTAEDALDNPTRVAGARTSQAETAAEQEALYRWWTVERPKRPDPLEASGFNALLAEQRAAGAPADSLTCPDGFSAHQRGLCHCAPEYQEAGVTDAVDPREEAQAARAAAAHRARDIEAAYAAEDEAALIRLARIRESLWT